MAGEPSREKPRFFLSDRPQVGIASVGRDFFCQPDLPDGPRPEARSSGQVSLSTG